MLDDPDQDIGDQEGHADNIECAMSPEEVKSTTRIQWRSVCAVRVLARQSSWPNSGKWYAPLRRSRRIQ